MVGGWYGPANEFKAVVDPYLTNLPPPSWKNVTSGTYIESVQNLGGSNQLNTTGVPDVHDTFYAKSLMTPEVSPMTITALTAFMNYVGSVGFTMDMVR